jgi:AMMECR1 domain-containing protein
MWHRFTTGGGRPSVLCLKQKAPGGASGGTIKTDALGGLVAERYVKMTPRAPFQRIEPPRRLVRRTASFAVPDDEETTGPNPDAFVATKEHVALCFDALEERIRRRAPALRPTEDTSTFEAQCNVFVAWENKGKENADFNLNPQLRDWRGEVYSPTAEAESLTAALQGAAAKAALEDADGRPLTSGDFGNFRCTVCLKGEEEPCGDDSGVWIVGTHGLVVRVEELGFPHTKREALFLPEVAEYHGWDKEKAKQEVLRKAGYDAPGAGLQVRFYCFTVTTMSLTFDECSELRA